MVVSNVQPIIMNTKLGLKIDYGMPQKKNFGLKKNKAFSTTEIRNLVVKNQQFFF